MALFYFNDTASGAANNANLSDPLNFASTVCNN